MLTKKLVMLGIIAFVVGVYLMTIGNLESITSATGVFLMIGIMPVALSAALYSFYLDRAEKQRAEEKKQALAEARRLEKERIAHLETYNRQVHFSKKVFAELNEAWGYAGRPSSLRPIQKFLAFDGGKEGACFIYVGQSVATAEIKIRIDLRQKREVQVSGNPKYLGGQRSMDFILPKGIEFVRTLAYCRLYLHKVGTVQ